MANEGLSKTTIIQNEESQVLLVILFISALERDWGTLRQFIIYLQELIFHH